MTALKKLIEAVEAGEPDAWHGCGDVLGVENGMNLHRAFDGSLDAAKALHEALLPGWDWILGEGGATVFEPHQTFSEGIDADNEIPSRAWLIAILKAYEAQQGDKS